MKYLKKMFGFRLYLFFLIFSLFVILLRNVLEYVFVAFLSVSFLVLAVLFHIDGEYNIAAPCFLMFLAHLYILKNLKKWLEAKRQREEYEKQKFQESQATWKQVEKILSEDPYEIYRKKSDE